MDSKKAGWLFLAIILCFLAVEVVVSFTPLGDELSIPAMMVMSELSFMLPVAVCFCRGVLCVKGRKAFRSPAEYTLYLDGLTAYYGT